MRISIKGDLSMMLHSVEDGLCLLLETLNATVFVGAIRSLASNKSR